MCNTANIVHEYICKTRVTRESIFAKLSFTLLVTESGFVRFFYAYKREDNLSLIYLYSNICILFIYIRSFFDNKLLVIIDLRFRK